VYAFKKNAEGQIIMEKEFAAFNTFYLLKLKATKIGFMV